MQETNRTFESQGYKFIIRELRDNFIALTVICQNYGTIFENDGQNLEKIKGKTVETALSKSNKAISYVLTRCSKELFLTVKVNLDYIPAFQQTIAMYESQKDPQSSFIHELKYEVKQLEQKLSVASLGSFSVKYTNFDGVANVNQRALMNLKQGDYLVEGTGVVNSLNYNEDYDGYSEFKFNGSMTIILQLQENKQQITQYKFDYIFNTMYGYETPFYFSQAVKLPNPGNISINIVDHSGTGATITQSILTIYQTCVLK